MIRVIWVVLSSIPEIIYYVCKARMVDRNLFTLSEEKRYRMAQKCIRIVQRHGRIVTVSEGQENLPKQGGYVMYSNHQGKYDTLGIMVSHDAPCTLVMDYYRSKLPIVDSFINLLQAKRLDKTDMKSQVRTIFSIVEEVKNGRRYIIFPEGGYAENRNELQNFMPGAFQCAMKAKAPIVPVAIIDSYKPFGMNSLRKVKTQVHFLKPIYAAEYQGMRTSQVAELTKRRIAETIENVKSKGECV